MPQKNSLTVMVFLCLLQLLVCPSLSQLALASSRYIQPPPAKRSPFEYRDTSPRRLFTKLSDLKPLSRINSSGIESEIAAIFKGVAYGSSTAAPTSQNKTVSPAISTTPSSTKPTKSSSESDVFIGKQKKVHLNVGSTLESFYLSPQEVEITKPDPTPRPPSYKHNTSYTYLIQTDNERVHEETLVQSNKNPTPDFMPLPEMPKEPIDEVQVRITTTMKNRGLEGVKMQIGKAWFLHVYATGIVFAIIAIVCLLSLSRINACCQMLPRGYFITLHLMLFLASFFRSILFFHDPYGAYGRLPIVLTSLLFNTVDPCLTTAFAVMLLVLLRGARMHIFPFKIQSPLVLAIICGVHIGSSVVVDVSSGVLENERLVSTLHVATQSATAAWGCILCLGFVFTFTSIEKAAQKLNEDMARLTLNRGNVGDSLLQRIMLRPSLTYAARLFLVCSLLHGLLIAFIILNLVTKSISDSPSSSEAWAWWTQNTLERIIEISLAVLLLGATLVLTQNKPRISKKKRDEKIFSIFDNCRRNAKGAKSVDVYPVANEKCKILANGTLSHSSPTSSLNYSTSGWKHFDRSSQDSSLKKPMTLNSINSEFQNMIKNDPQLEKTFMLNQQLNSDCIMRYENERDFTLCNYYKGLNTWEKPLEFQQYPDKGQCLTLPSSKYYCPQINEICGNQSLKPKSVHCNNSPVYNFNRTQGTRMSNQHLCKQSAYSSGSSKCDNDYEIASYYSNSNASTSSNIYSRPYTQYHCHNQGITETNLQPPVHTHSKAFSKGYDAEPKSEISACSSYSEIQVDYLTDASSVDGLQGSLSRSLTLPISSQHLINRGNHSSRCNVSHTPVPVHLKDVNSSHLTHLNSMGPCTKESLKGQTPIFSNFVPIPTSNLSYSPLNADKSLPSSDIIVRSNSVGDFVEQNESESVITPHSESRDPVTSL